MSNSFAPVKILSIAPIKEEVAAVLSTDVLNDLYRRALIALRAFGEHDPRIPPFLGLSQTRCKELLNSEEFKQVKEENEGKIVCWTKHEIIARLCVEAENAPKSADKINALKLLMEYRGMASSQAPMTFNQIVNRYSGKRSNIPV